MEQTRVKKYKDYRNSLSKREGEVFTSYTKHQATKKDVDELLNPRKEDTPSISTLSISYEQIFEASQNDNDDEIIRQKRKKYILKVVAIAVGCSLLLAAIIIAAIFIF